MPTQNLYAHEKTIKDVFSNEYAFSIPDYQRPYAWTIDEAQTLFDDLLEAERRTRTQPKDNRVPYFLGSIVLIKPSPLTPDAWVVDGQQRLTTITLLMAVLREHVPENIAKGITTSLYQERDDTDLTSSDRFRLILRMEDRDFFQYYVQKRADGDGGIPALLKLATLLETSAQERVRENTRLFDRLISGLSDDDRRELVIFIKNHCYMVVVCTVDRASACRIFGVLNTRGLDLLATDIIKSDVIGAIDQEEHRREYSRKWVEAEEMVGRDDFETLFGHIRMVYRKKKPESDLLAEFQESVRSAVPEPERLIDKVIAPYSSALDRVQRQSYECERGDLSATINENMKWLCKLFFSDWVPPALLALTTKQDAPEWLAWFFGELERVSYYLLLKKAGINERIARYSSISALIEASDTDLSARPEIGLDILEKFDIDTLLERPLYDDLSARSCGLLLLRLDALLSSGEAQYKGRVTIEHVLPQTPAKNSAWLDWFPEEQERRLWANRIGNLVLLSRSRNSAAQNYEFKIKKDYYVGRRGKDQRVTPFVLTNDVLMQSDWTIETLKARHERLTKVLKSYWGISAENPSL